MTFGMRGRAHTSLPGSPAPYFLARGEGDAAMVFDGLFTVLAGASETDGQFGLFAMDSPSGDTIPSHRHADTHETFFVVEGLVRVFVQTADGAKTSRLLRPGDFGFVPAGLPHAYRVEQAARMLGVVSAGFERFFETLGTPIGDLDAHHERFHPDATRFERAGREYRTEFLPDLTWPEE